MENSSSTVTIKKSYYYLAVLLIGILAAIVFYAAKQESNGQIALRAKPALPIQVKVRKALLGPGEVVILTNISATQLPVLATFTSPKTHATLSKQLLFEPQKVIEIGYAEGWAFSAGDTMKLTNIDYSEAQYTIK